MKKSAYIFFLSILPVFFSSVAIAGNPMEEYFYASGKYRVVIWVAAIVLAGIFVYLFSLDRRLKRLENKKK